MLLLETQDIKNLVQKEGLKNFYKKLFEYLQSDFTQWESFEKSSRHAVYVENGVIELMPISGPNLYSFKYVNGHPQNTKLNLLSVIAFGLLSLVETGYPLMLASMTVLTALRTAGISALASKYLAKPNSKILTIIGCGAQSEFQVLAHDTLFELSEVRYFDLDPKAMARFAEHLSSYSFKLTPGQNAKSLLSGSDIIITTTAAPGKHHILKLNQLEPGQHIAGIGGDSPGKTELDPEILKNSKLVIEYFPQTSHEGEIQNLGMDAQKYVYSELWEIISGKKPGRSNNEEITVFDAVGFALEDYSILRLVYELAKKFNIGKDINLVPENLLDAKNLFGFLTD